MKFSPFNKKSKDQPAAPMRTATVHRSERTSLFRRMCGMWLPLVSLGGMVGLSLNTMFVILGSVNLEEMRSAPVLRVSQGQFDQLAKAVAIADQDERNREVELVISNAFSRRVRGKPAPAKNSPSSGSMKKASPRSRRSPPMFAGAERSRISRRPGESAVCTPLASTWPS